MPVKAVAPRRETVVILDFGSQYTQLIGRRVRENKVFSRILPYNTSAEDLKAMAPKGIILSGGPSSVYGKKVPMPDKNIFKLGIPILGVCYGMQLIAQIMGGKVKHNPEREYGKTELFIDNIRDLFMHLPGNITSWMSHGDMVAKLPHGFTVLAHTLNSPIAAMANTSRKIYGVQFHPEVTHTSKGDKILGNFLFRVCGCVGRWTMQSFINESIAQIKKTVGDKKVVLGLSGGVDSSVCAILVNRAIGKNLKCIFIDNGLLRKDEAQQVEKTFDGMYHLNLSCVDKSKRFLDKLKGVTDPEQKRKIIGEEFIRVFEEEAEKVKGAEFLAQGTLYPDVIESTSPIGSPSACIKSHHNVGGLPLHMKLKLIEPLRELFKDEVREIGRHLGLPDTIIYRQPFPGPGLSIRVIGDVTEERLRILREVDKRLIEEIRSANLYLQVWQSFAILLPIKSVGVMGDTRTYENVIAIRCVESQDGMTADWAKLSPELLDKVAHRIINEVKGVNRVVYDISSKPPATIEWE
ncbi:MAG: glutamine-hydrolyzing GMP synthase [Candidatus Omnitrophica bacterium]|nr:glutamine-hydrolyzing GMP synthase [Candidatus Omnitrophota bacterium]